MQGSIYNVLDEKRINYVLNMRKELCNRDICAADGSLNIKYFNVKKGHYWSKQHSELLIVAVIKHGVCEHKKIKKEFFPQWTETEVRLRTCKLLRYYNLDDYIDKRFETK